MTPIPAGTRVRDSRHPDAAKRAIVGTARADSDRIAETCLVAWDGGGSSLVWVGRLVAAGEGA